jgi:hypothetical protein
VPEVSDTRQQAKYGRGNLGGVSDRPPKHHEVREGWFVEEAPRT